MCYHYWKTYKTIRGYTQIIYKQECSKCGKQREQIIKK